MDQGVRRDTALEHLVVPLGIANLGVWLSMTTNWESYEDDLKVNLENIS
jgi:hypothetical protein